MAIDEKSSTEKITPGLIDYIVDKIVHEIKPEFPELGRRVPESDDPTVREM